MHKARLYTRLDDHLRCGLCYHSCRIKEGQTGICGVRVNRGGELYTLVYGKVVAENVDPIEKKPLFHVLPGTGTYSFSTRGCNFRCLHCQNSTISQVERNADPGQFCRDYTPEDIVNAAMGEACQSISYTYVEPTIFYEFAMDCAELAVSHGLKNLFVSNGYMSEEAGRNLAPLLYGINIDCKSFRDDFYKKVCGARLQPVLDSIRLFVEHGVWVEVTTLIIPGMNDSPEELRELSRFLADLSRDIPWHVTAFHPSYKLTSAPPTPLSTLEMAREIGLEAGLHYVYAGNIPGSGYEDTVCPGCGETLIKRRGFMILENRLHHGTCKNCEIAVAGRWE